MPNTLIPEVFPLIKFDPSFKVEFKKYLQHFFDVNSEVLADNSIYQKPVIVAKDTAYIMSIYDGPEAKIKQSINNSTYGKPLAGALKTPTYIILYLLFLKFFRAKDKQFADATMLCLTYRMYSSIFSKYFIHGVKKEVMDYTIANLSNKYDIKRLGSLLLALKKMNESIIENAKKTIDSDDDKAHFDFLMALRTRVNSFVKNIFAEFKGNYEKGYYLNIDKLEQFEDSGDYKERGSNSMLVVSKADSFQIQFSTSITNTTVIKAISRETQLGYSDLLNIIEEIKKSYLDNVREISISVFNMMLNLSKNENLRVICSATFIPYVLNQFKKNNTSDPDILSLKKNLDEILLVTSRVFKTTEREATKSAYRSAILRYILLSIQRFVCK